MRQSHDAPVTAVLAVYNSENTIRPCLESLLAQSVPLEIIVVDDGSTDNTCAIVTKYKVKLLQQNHAGPAIARNYGVKHAQGEIVLFVDADMTFDADYVRELIAPIIGGQEIGTYTVEECVANWDNVFARCWNWQEGWQDEKRFPPNPPRYGTDFRAILKAEFERVGGFDNIGYTDTWTLFHKLNKRPRATHAVCYHHNPSDLTSVYRQAKWAAKRPYKLGIIGSLYALQRTSAPLSLIKGIQVSIVKNDYHFLIFKCVYDWGRFVGIIELLLTGKKAK